MTALNIASLARPEPAPAAPAPLNVAAMAQQDALPSSEAPPAPAPGTFAARMEALLLEVQSKLTEVSSDGFVHVLASKVVTMLMSEGRMQAIVESVMADMVRQTANANLPTEIPAGAEASAAVTPAIDVAPSVADDSVSFTRVYDPSKYPFGTLLVFSPTIGANLDPSTVDVNTWSVDDHGDTAPVKLHESYHTALLKFYRENSNDFGFGQQYIVQMGIRNKV